MSGWRLWGFIAADRAQAETPTLAVTPARLGAIAPRLFKADQNFPCTGAKRHRR